MRKLISLMLFMMVIVVGCKKDDPVISEYIVTFNTQGGSNIDALKVVEGQKVTKPQDPTKENYIFSGWYKVAACTTVWDFDKETIMSNVTLYAKWVEATQACVVTFDAQGGSEVAPLTVNKGEKLVKPTDPTKTDCSFLGWYKDTAYTSAWEFSTDVVNGDITLYARWSNPGEAVYTVTFDTDGGNEMEPASVKANEKLTMPANPQKLGFDFRGWYSDTEKQIAYDFKTPVTGDMTLYAKWVKSNVRFDGFYTAALTGSGVVWDATTQTLDITNAKQSVVFSFNIEGVATVEPNIVPVYDKQAKSIGGTGKLDEILKVGAVVSNKITAEIKTPVQSLKVPLDIKVIIADASNPNETNEITIKSRPKYADTDYQPVMMKTTDGKTVFWAPINVGTKRMVTSVPSTGDITDDCGYLYQWGRNYGFRATTDATITAADTTGVKAVYGYPAGQGALVNLRRWDGKFIYSSSENPNTQGNWLLFEAGKDNPEGADMEDDAWYQKLWNSGTEEDPVKTEYDPCPEGWRVPTISEWQAIGAGNTSIIKEWDDVNKLMTIAGAESGQKFVLPTAGHRGQGAGTSYKQGSAGYYWSSSVPSGNVKVYHVSFNSTVLNVDVVNRTYGFSMRCVQE